MAFKTHPVCFKCHLYKPHENDLEFLFCRKIAEVLGLTQFQEDIRMATQLDLYMAAYSYPCAHKSCVVLCDYQWLVTDCFK